LDLADIWYDLTTTDIPDARLDDKDISESGFIMYMSAHHFLWTYPKNSDVLASRFKICTRYARGEPLWRWIKKIQALKAKKIRWDSRLNDPNTEIFILSVDGTDFRIWEKKHPTRNIDKKFFSKKFNHCAVKYEIAISIFRPSVVWINGPFRGGMHDMPMFRAGLKAKMKQSAPGKMGIGDSGYRTGEADEVGMIAVPESSDPPGLKTFKARVRCRHESFNGRLKFFKSLSDTFRHGVEKHKIVFEAVATIVQYQMDNGSPIFDA
jgi:hypothetical protein